MNEVTIIVEGGSQNGSRLVYPARSFVPARTTIHGDNYVLRGNSFVLDDAEPQDFVVFKRDRLFELLGKVGLPPGLWSGDSSIDCAPIAEELVALVEEYRER